MGAFGLDLGFLGNNGTTATAVQVRTPWGNASVQSLTNLLNPSMGAQVGTPVATDSGVSIQPSGPSPLRWIRQHLKLSIAIAAGAVVLAWFALRKRG